MAASSSTTRMRGFAVCMLAKRLAAHGRAPCKSFVKARTRSRNASRAGRPWPRSLAYCTARAKRAGERRRGFQRHVRAAVHQEGAIEPKSRTALAQRAAACKARVNRGGFILHCRDRAPRRGFLKCLPSSYTVEEANLMALINRMSRLFTADVHAVLDRIEEPDVLLK